MSTCYYRLLLGFAASLSVALAGCGSQPPAPPPPASRAVSSTSVGDPDNTDATIWTVLGLAKRESIRSPGPQTGPTVSPVLWEAALDAVHFAGTSSEDPVAGLLVSKWYSPSDKPDERLRVTVFITSRALRSDSLSLTVERQTRSVDGAWQQTPVASDVVYSLESTILQRAQQIHAERYRNTMYN